MPNWQQQVMTPQLKTEIWVSALIRRAQVGGASAFVMQKGDPDAGIVLVKICTLDGKAFACFPERDYSPEPEDSPELEDSRGARIWRLTQRLPEREIETRIKKRAAGDPDVWIVEIEDKQGRSFLTEAQRDMSQ